MLGTSKSVWGFDPRTIPGCQLWLDGADSTTVTGTTSVTAWRDKSVNGYVANSFVNSVPNPSWVSNVRNGNGVIQYSAGNGSSIANFVLAQTMSIFKVYYPINQSTGSPFIEHGPNENAESGFYFHAQEGNNFAINSGTGQIFVNFGTTTVSNTWQMIEGINPDPANGNTMAFYVNGTTRASGSTQSGTTTVTKTLYINGRAGTSSVSYNNYLAELIIYNIAVTTSQRQQIEGYLAHKWGLTGYYDSSIPLSIPGCQLWLDGRDTSSMTFSDSTITQWNDKSGNGYNATIAPDRVGAVYSTTYNAVNFASSTTGYITNYSAAPTNETMFVVGNNPSPSSPNNIIIGGVSGARSLGLGYTNAGTGTIGNLNTQVVWLASVGGYIAGTTALVRSQFTPSSNSVSFNGGSTATGGAPGFTAGRVTYLGVDATNGYFHYNGYMMEALFYNRILTTTEIQTIEGYLAKKWGLTSLYTALPSTHPFSSIPPHLRVFQPNDVPGCQLWLDAADSSTITYGTGLSIASWRDKANGYAVANSSAAHRPVYSQGTIRFNGITSPSYLDIPTLTIGSSAFSIFFVMQNTGPASGNAYAPHFFWPLSGNGSGALSMTGWLNTNIQGINANISSTLLKNQYYTISYTFGVTTNFEQLYANGISIGTYQKSSGYSASLYRIGAINTASTETSLDGNIGEVLVYNTALTTSQRQTIEWYLANKWAIFSTSPVSTPLTISGCGIWLDGADTSSMTLSSGAITQWRDKSGSSNHFTTSSGTPTSISDNGKTVANFTPGAIMTSANQISFTTSSAFFIVSKLSGDVVNWGNMLLGFTNINDGDKSIRFVENRLIGTGGFGDGNELANGSYYVNGTFNPSFGSSTYLNVYSLISTLAPQSGGTSFVTLSSSFMDRNFVGNIAEFIFYPGGVSDIQRQKIEGYLARKWGLTLPAPTVHPYDKFPPASLHTVVIPTSVRIINLGSGSGGATSGSFTMNSLVGGGTGTFTNSDVFMSDGGWGMAQCFDGGRSDYDLYMTQNPNFMELIFPRELMVTKIFLVPRNQQDAFPSSLTLKADGTLVGTYTPTTVSQALGMGISYSGTGFYIQPAAKGTTWRFDFTSTPVSFGEIEFWGYLPT